MTNEIDCYYQPGDGPIFKTSLEVLKMADNPSTARQALARWQTFLRCQFNLSGVNNDLSDLVSGVLYGKIGDSARARTILWKEFDRRPDSFIRSLHWMLFVMETEAAAHSGEIFDAEIFLEGRISEWGRESVKSLALQSCFALFCGDYPVLAELLEELTAAARTSHDLHWAYRRAAETSSIDLPSLVRLTLNDLLKEGLERFPLDTFLYQAYVKSLFLSDPRDQTLRRLAAAEIKAGNFERLDAELRRIFETVINEAH